MGLSQNVRLTSAEIGGKICEKHHGLIATASGYYGAAFSLSQGRDLATKYA